VVLGRKKLEVDTITVDRFPQDLEGLSQFDLVVLADVPAGVLGAGQLEAIEAYVRDRAGGLIVFGGQDSLTAGDYRGTALERALPVTSEFDVQAKRPSLALVLAIDQSGSMEEGDAIGLAKTALRQTVQMLDAQDELGVIAFHDTAQWIVPLQPCDDKEKVVREIETLSAGGGTNMHPAIAKAHLALHEAYAELKHIIVLTDGISYPGDFDSLVAEVAASGITISTVAVGSKAAEPLLQSIAELGGGNYHHCTNAAEVPEIFVRETVKAARMGIREDPVIVEVAPAFVAIASRADERPPTLLGYVQTKARPDAQVGMALESGDPLVAWWQFGRGRSAVFTSDLRGAWTRPWQNWPGLETVWTALARQTVRPAYSHGYRLTCKRADAATLVTLDAVPYPDRFENDAEVVLDVTAPSGAKRRTVMPRVAPGQYSVHVATPEADTYDFQAMCTVTGRSVFSGRCSACPAYPGEWMPRATNESLLQEVATATGGQFNPAAGEVVAREGVGAVETYGVGYLWVVVAVVVMVGELALRRFS
jgi:Mg-chelatase subunit ChlD